MIEFLNFHQGHAFYKGVVQTQYWNNTILELAKKCDELLTRLMRYYHWHNKIDNRFKTITK